MNKILCLGDIHGRTIWKDIIEKENPDKVIFLGDYVSTHDLNISSDQQIEQLYSILSYKDENPDKVILLRGNHDLSMLGSKWYNNPKNLWQEIAEPYLWTSSWSGFDKDVFRYVSTRDVTNWFLKNTQWIYIDEDLKTIFSHAGISTEWLNKYVEPYLIKEKGSQYDDGTIDLEIVLNLINTIPVCTIFGFFPSKISDYCGESSTQSCTWIRPWTLQYYMIEGYKQVVGHTPQDKVIELYPNLWCCDALENNSYLVIEDGQFISKTL